VENVLEHEGDDCVSNPLFVDDHPIIFWNLIWYFKRINLPSHLPGLALYASTTNKSKQIPASKSRSYDYRNVLVRCLWDNDKLHEDMRKPMYRLWCESSSQSSLLHALVTDERKVSHSVMRHILTCIHNNDMVTPMKLLTNERRKSVTSNTKHYYSVYRDLLFLSFVALGRENIDHVAFDREYRRAYDMITPKQQLVVSVADKPPSDGAIFCRRFFKELELKSLSLENQEPSTVSSVASLA
jgi:hypothetical protein